MTKKYLTFDTIPCKAPGNPGGYRLQLQQGRLLTEGAAYREAIQRLSLNLSEETVAFLVETVLRAFVEKVAEDGVPRRIGNLLKFTPMLRGRVPGVNSPYDPATVKTGVTVTALKGLRCALDEERLAFVNSNPEKRIILNSMQTMSEGSKEDVLLRGKPFVALGRNLFYRADLGDRVEVSWRAADGSTRTTVLVPQEVQYFLLRFDWPAALDEAPARTKLTFVFTLRGGVENAAPREKRVVCTLKD